MTRRTILSCVAATMICTMSSFAHADEKSSTAAIRKIGGDVRVIAKNVKLKEISLQLTDQDVTDAVLVDVAAIPDVAWLNLRGTKITDAGLANVGKMKTLTRLHLELTGISDAGLAHLKGLENLEYLNLYGTQVTDAGLEHLKSLKKLKKAFVWQSKVTPKGAEALAKAMPGLRVNIGTKPAAPPAAKK